MFLGGFGGFWGFGRFEVQENVINSEKTRTIIF